MATHVLPDVILPSQQLETIIQYDDFFRKERLKQLKLTIFRAHLKIATGVFLGLNLKLETSNFLLRKCGEIHSETWYSL